MREAPASKTAHKARRRSRHLGALLVLPILPMTVSCGGVLGSSGSDGDLAKEITFVVPYSPGGDFDTSARILAPYLEKHLPEGTTVTVENVPGGNGTIGVNEVMSGDTNGSTIGIFNLPGFWVAPITGEADYDLNEVEWLGVAEESIYVAAASAGSGIESLDDVRDASTLEVGVAALTDTASVGAQIGLDDLGLDDSINVTPHDGSSEALLSAVRGDMDFVQFPFGTMSDHIVDSDDLTPLWVYAEERLEELPDTPTFEEVGGDPALLDIITLYRAVGTAPGTDPEALETLREAMTATMEDEELREEMVEVALNPEFQDADATAETTKVGEEQMEKHRELFE